MSESVGDKIGVVGGGGPLWAIGSFFTEASKVSPDVALQLEYWEAYDLAHAWGIRFRHLETTGLNRASDKRRKS